MTLILIESTVTSTIIQQIRDNAYYLFYISFNLRKSYNLKKIVRHTRGTPDVLSELYQLRCTVGVRDVVITYVTLT